MPGKVLTLEQRMELDFSERLNGDPISASVLLSPVAIMRDPGAKEGFSTLGLPGFFCGDRDAQTVVINLNPGMDASLSDSHWGTDTKAFDTSSLDSFIKDYSQKCRDYGLNDADRYDEFDIKQAAFWMPWDDSGISFRKPVDWGDTDYCLEAKKSVLMDKLQLELVPYASSKFSIDKDKIGLFRPFVQTLLDEIFRKSRKYVVFASAVFEDIFKDYNSVRPGTFKGVSGPNQSTQLTKNDGNPTQKRFNCKVITIHKDGEKQKALIARSFPRQDISKAFYLMQQYGEFCFDVWKKA